jgi:hypothetical protein
MIIISERPLTLLGKVSSVLLPLTAIQILNPKMTKDGSNQHFNLQSPFMLNKLDCGADDPS